jgi:LysR family glycine cleavage system transcriptional activator
MSVSPPRPKGPPLTALRAFEAAARLGGFARAAEELGVTAGAVTQQIKGLEDWIGAELFERQAQGVRLSLLGARVAADFTAAFDDLGRAVQGLRTAAGGKVVHIATLPSIAHLWLSPRLPMIRRALPDVTVSITAIETPPNLLRDTFDVGIFYSDAAAGPLVMPIEADEIFPVCAPDLAAGLRVPDDLANVPLIGDSTWAQDWDIWLGQSGAAGQGATYSLYSLAVAEAVQGAGVLIGHKALVAAYLQAGSLVEPFDKRVALGRSLSLLLPQPLQGDGAVVRICRMLLQG